MESDKQWSEGWKKEREVTEQDGGINKVNYI